MITRTGQQGKFSSFKDKVAFNSAQSRSKTGNYGHLLLPRGVSVFKEEPASRVDMDMIPYIIKEDRHPDRDEERDVAVKGSMWYKRPYKLHRSVGPENVNLVCPVSFGKRCPICEHRSRLLAQGADWKDEAVKSARPSDRNVYYVIPKGHKKFEERIHIWDISNFLFQQHLDEELDENPDFGMFPDLESGLMMRIRFSEETFERNKYAATSRIDFVERDYAYGEEMIKDLVPLDQVLQVKDYRDISSIYHEGEDVAEAEDGAEEDEAPRVAVMARPKANGSTKPIARMTRSDPKPQEEPEEDEAPVEEPVEEAPPPRQVMRRAEPAKPVAAPVAAKPAAKPVSRPAPAAVASGECPSGYQFGIECDKHDECEECPVWSDCYAAQEAAE